MIAANEKDKHQENYAVYAKTAIVLLLFTALNIIIAGLIHTSLGSGIIVLISVIQAFIALSWFMHLRFDSLLLKLLVAGVFLLYLVVIVITFFDYSLR